MPLPYPVASPERAGQAGHTGCMNVIFTNGTHDRYSVPAYAVMRHPERIKLT